MNSHSKAFEARRGDRFGRTDSATWYRTEDDAKRAEALWNSGRNAEAIAVPTVSVGHIHVDDKVALAAYWCVVYLMAH